MNTRAVALPLLAGLLAASLAAAAAESPAPKRYPLAGHGFLVLKVPSAWLDRLDDQPSKDAPPSISFSARQGKPFIATVAAQWREKAGDSPPDRASVRQRAQLALESIAPFAVEKDIKLVEFKGAAGPGFRFFATDSAPGPGEYKFMTRGVLAVGELTVMFTILTNEGQDGVIRDGLAMLQSATHVQR